MPSASRAAKIGRPKEQFTERERDSAAEGCQLADASAVGPGLPMHGRSAKGDGPEGDSSSSGFSADQSAASEVRVEAWREVAQWAGGDVPDWSARTTGSYLVGESSVRVLRALATPSALLQRIRAIHEMSNGTYGV